MTDFDPILQADELLRRDVPSLWAALSPLGRRLRQPANFLPLQSAEARGKPFNATIGQITDGKGRAVPLPAMAEALKLLDPAEASQALLYSPVEGLAPLRRAYRVWQRRGQPESLPSTLPLVTDGIFHARGLALQLFVPPGRTVIAAPAEDDPSLRELVEVRLKGRLIEVEPGGALLDALEREIGSLPEGEPAVLLLETRPAGAGTPGSGPALGGGEIARAAGSAPKELLVQALVRHAARRPLVVALDDSREPLDVPSTSLFWSLAGRSESLVPIKMDGAEGSWGFPGGRVGFLTFGYPEDGPVARALESKIKMLLRAEVGSPSSFTQTLFHRMLNERLLR